MPKGGPGYHISLATMCRAALERLMQTVAREDDDVIARKS